jgi:hypothetical protein
MALVRYGVAHFSRSSSVARHRDSLRDGAAGDLDIPLEARFLMKGKSWVGAAILNLNRPRRIDMLTPAKE